MRHNYKTLIAALVPTFAFGLLAGCTPPKAPDRTEEYKENLQAANSKVDKDTVKTDEEEFLASRGTIESKQEIPISSKIAGQVVEVNVLMGQRVRHGQVLVRLDDRNLRDEIKHAKAVIEQCKHKYQSILLGLGYKLETLSTANKEQKKQALVASNLEVAETEYNMLCNRLNDYVIKAPIDGLVCAFDDFNHKNVAAGDELFTVIDDRHLMVTFEVLEREIGFYEVGTKVNAIISAYGEETHVATVTRVSPRIGENGMILVKASLPYSKHLKVGMTALIKRMK